ncbi:MAG: cyclase family protein [Acidobacteria bacterium]|nr:cyclase family protein [Acidobacteriota bacterium]
MLDQLLDLLESAEIHDLGQPYFVGMPHHPAHPPYQYSLSKAHGEFVRETGSSSAAEAIALGGHVGTHIDALSHFSMCGKFFGGIDAESNQSYGGGMTEHGVDKIRPILSRVILLDVAAYKGKDVLPADFVIDAELLERVAAQQGTEIREGDIALVRTGWAVYWSDAGRYINQLKNPGVNLEAAQWLSSKGVFAGGSDTVAFEHLPSETMPVHVHLLVEKGIHIIEALNLETLAENERYEFAFIAAPLKLTGGTGAPIRPLAAAL